MSRKRPEPTAPPAVNLLSESAFVRLAARRLRQRFVAGGVVMVLLVGKTLVKILDVAVVMPLG